MAAPPTSPSRELPPVGDDLVLGVATASHQIEGAATAHGKGRSIWDAFAQVPGAIARGESGARGIEHVERLEADLDQLAWMGVDAYRFSIAWPRIQPTGRGRPVAAGLDLYDRLVDGLLERGIAPWVTLYHWDLPAVLQDDLGGWAHRDVAGRFADYAALVGDALSDRVASWATLNEPWCAAFLGYAAGRHAPGVADDALAVAAAHHLLLGHGLAVQALRSVGAEQIGIVLNPSEARPASDRDEDLDAARRVDGTNNRWWLGALTGAYPDDVASDLAEVADLDAIVHDGDLDVTAEPLDWLGINNYFPTVVEAGTPTPDDADVPDGQRRLPAVGPALDGVVVVPPSAPEPSTMMGWRIDPDGLAAVLRQAHEWLPDLPIAITETGIALPERERDQDDVDDPERIAFLTDALATALRLRDDEDLPLQAFFVWTMWDNFEWAEGYAPRFGLVHVDRETFARTPRRSARWYRELIADRARGRG